MKIFDLVKKKGVVTKPYPLAPYEMSENFRGRPEYTYALCIGCASCGVACPPNAISVKIEDEKSVVWRYDTGRCIFCGRCEEVCPTKAIKLSSKFELGVNFNRADLHVCGTMEAHNCSQCGKAFTSKRFVQTALSRITASNMSDDRKKLAREYTQICPACKRENTAAKMRENDYQRIV
ncbi:4Fe-4S dicluster domain-containing protein [Campylobacter sp. JMF_08 NE1]|uniref:4Fe-4S dicluster domain-containing protein n=1 Tax=Campylobacter sp. JMF_08 NE1 TaxID=2983821 RepID=UPI0022E9C19A|nr:4Fe-4S dicluster domain-containing protein [Campylobacter sp. JMF_08 NE1]MDA3047483.1 4Fe-4S dicluster domain-containing protein [Campylobacter sp. JMF_08 NE1]